MEWTIAMGRKCRMFDGGCQFSAAGLMEASRSLYCWTLLLLLLLVLSGCNIISGRSEKKILLFLYFFSFLSSRWKFKRRNCQCFAWLYCNRRRQGHLFLPWYLFSSSPLPFDSQTIYRQLTWPHQFLVHSFPLLLHIYTLIVAVAVVVAVLWNTCRGRIFLFVFLSVFFLFVVQFSWKWNSSTPTSTTQIKTFLLLLLLLLLLTRRPPPSALPAVYFHEKFAQFLLFCCNINCFIEYMLKYVYDLIWFTFAAELGAWTNCQGHFQSPKRNQGNGWLHGFLSIRNSSSSSRLSFSLLAACVLIGNEQRRLWKVAVVVVVGVVVLIHFNCRGANGRRLKMSNSFLNVAGTCLILTIRHRKCVRLFSAITMCAWRLQRRCNQIWLSIDRKWPKKTEKGDEEIIKIY